MTNTTKMTVRRMKTYITGLSVLILASAPTSASATENSFEVKIKHASDATVQASYVAMKEQAIKYCSREARRVDDRGISMKYRRIYTQKCTDQVMGKVIAQVNEPELTAFHSLQGASTATKSIENKRAPLD